MIVSSDGRIFDDRQHIRNIIKNRLEKLPEFLLSFEEVGPGAIRVVFVQKLVFLVGDSVGEANTSDNCPILIAAKPVTHLIAQCPKR